MAHYSHQTKNPLGLDLSDISLKLLQLGEHRTGDKLVVAYSDISIPKDVISGDMIKDPRVLVSTIKKALNSPKFGKFTTPYVVASIPETKSFVRVIEMPAMSEDEAREAIPWEAEAYIPLPISQVYLDWLILGRNTPDKMTVLITAAPKDYIDDYTSILKETGLIPLAIEVESQATARSLVSKNNETVLILDIDTVRTSLIIYDKGTLEFTSSIPIAGNVFTESIAKNSGVSFGEAEKLKRSSGLDDPGEKGIKRALSPVLNNLIAEITSTIRFYEEHAGAEDKVSRILLSGGSSKLKHLSSFLQDKFSHLADDTTLKSFKDLKIELGNPWVNVNIKGQTPPLSREDSLSYATAIGLALREDE